MTENINLTDALKKYFGFDTFQGNQEAIIRNMLAGNDTFVLMPTEMCIRDRGYTHGAYFGGNIRTYLSCQDQTHDGGGEFQ